MIRDDAKSRALMEKAGVAGVVSMRVVSNEQRITSTPRTFWVATSRTTNPSNAPSFIREESRGAAGALRRQGLIR